MTPLLEAAVELQSFFEERKWPFAIIGGIAVLAWGQPRTTQDVDACLLTGFGSEESFVNEMLMHFAPARADTRQLAEVARIVTIRASNGAGLDVSLGAFPFEERAVFNARKKRLLGASLRLVTANDLVVFKAFANREKDWLDLRGILIRQRGKLDWSAIMPQLAEVVAMKDEPEIVDRLNALQVAVDKI